MPSYAETAILVDEMNQDYSERDDKLDDFSPHELEIFIDQLESLVDAAKDALGRKSAR